MISTKQYTDTYNLWRESLLKSAENISRSSECRKYLIKNTASAPWEDLLTNAVECIYKLTGDECFYKEVMEAIERREADNEKAN